MHKTAHLGHRSSWRPPAGTPPWPPAQPCQGPAYCCSHCCHQPPLPPCLCCCCRCLAGRLPRLVLSACPRMQLLRACCRRCCRFRWLLLWLPAVLRTRLPGLCAAPRQNPYCAAPLRDSVQTQPWQPVCKVYAVAASANGHWRCCSVPVIVCQTSRSEKDPGCHIGLPTITAPKPDASAHSPAASLGTAQTAACSPRATAQMGFASPG